MLRTVRMVLAVLSLILLSVGYAASQFAYPQNAAEYASKIDQPVIWRLSLAFLIVAVVLAFVPEGEGADRS